MQGLNIKEDNASEEFLADLTLAAYQVALKQGIKGSFLDLELGLHSALHSVLQKQLDAKKSKAKNRAQ